MKNYFRIPFSGQSQSCPHFDEQDDPFVPARRDSSTSDVLARAMQDNELLQQKLTEVSLGRDRLGLENSTLRQELIAAREEANRLEARLSQLLADRTSQRTDTLTVNSTAHIEIAQVFRNFVDQDLNHLARLNVAAGEECSPTYIPHTIAALCWALFGRHTIVVPAIEKVLQCGAAVPGERIDSLCAQARHLRARATAADHEHRWDFKISTGSMLDPTRQRAWSTCDPNHPVQFLVTPAYVSNNQIYGLQQVYTSPPIS